MNQENIRLIVLNAVETTQPTWGAYEEHWHCIDKIFLIRAYEQGGFEAWKFGKPLYMNSIFSIEKIGSIFDEYKGVKKYRRDFAGSLEDPFYIDLKNGKYGEEGQKFYKSVKEFKGNSGQSFYRLLWWMLVCCNFLKTYYKGSFSYFLKKKYAEFKDMDIISDNNFKKISIEDWEEFKKKKNPWNELYGVGPNVFDFIIGDTGELKFLEDSYKLDLSNKHFIKVTGIYKDEITREKVINFIKELNLPYTLREINTAIFLYCSEGNKKDCGFCRNPKKCQECAVNDICEKNF